MDPCAPARRNWHDRLVRLATSPRAVFIGRSRNFLRRLRSFLFPPRPSATPHIASILNGAKLVAVDVGGARGLLPHWLPLKGAAHFYLFEPHPESCQELVRHFSQTPHPDLYQVLPIALSEHGGKRMFYETNVPTGSGFLPPEAFPLPQYHDADYFFPYQSREMETRSLRDVLDSLGEARLDMIKLDVQGTELEILRGLRADRLNRLLCVELEVNLHAQPGVPEVESFLKTHGMEVFDVRVSRTYLPHPQKGQSYAREVFGVYDSAPGIAARAWEFDLICFRKAELVLASGDANEVRRLIVAYGTYAFFLEALRLLEKAVAAKLFDATQTQAVKADLVAWYHKLHGSRWYRATPFYGWVRQTLRRVNFPGNPRWAQHMWVEFPSC